MTDTLSCDLTAADAEVAVYLNTTTNEHGRPEGIVDGYQSGHTLERVLIYRVPAVPTVVGINLALEQVFFDLNVGDDPHFVANQKPAVVEYRAQGRRSLSVGDVVELLGGRYAVARCGFQRLDDTDATPDAERDRSLGADQSTVK